MLARLEIERMGKDGRSERMEIGDDAQNAVQFNFNVSGNPDIDRIKLLGAAFIQACNDIGSSRELSVAKTEIEAATMWAVKGAVKIDQAWEESAKDHE